MRDCDAEHLTQAITSLACAVGEFRKEIGREERRVLTRVENKLDALLKQQDNIMAKLSELEGSLIDVRNKVTKSYTEIRAKLDELNAKIEALETGVGDAEVPANITTLVDELKALGQQLDDIVPDPAEPTPV